MPSVRVAVRVSPGAARTEWVGRLADGSLKARVAAPPEGGRANRELVALVARSLGVRASAVRLVAGGSSRDKVLEVSAGADRLESLGRSEAAPRGRAERGRKP